jgi:hypothetical protein
MRLAGWGGELVKWALDGLGGAERVRWALDGLGGAVDG